MFRPLLLSLQKRESQRETTTLKYYSLKPKGQMKQNDYKNVSSKEEQQMKNFKKERKKEKKCQLRL